MAGRTRAWAGLRTLKYTWPGNPFQHKAWAVCVGWRYWSDFFVRLFSFQLINSDMFLKWAFLPSESMFLWEIRNRVEVLRSIHESMHHLMTSLEYLGGPSPLPQTLPYLLTPLRTFQASAEAQKVLWTWPTLSPSHCYLFLSICF